jgi:ABC-type transport system involved in cytochrome c biogenesis permease component
MNVAPVISRELRSAARQPFTYNLRVAGVALSLVTIFLTGSFAMSFANQQGLRLLEGIHFTLFWATWVLVPLGTADCLSRERREGTLGLLFLTPLKARDVVAAKGVAHALRALTLWVAVTPILMIPFLMGGVTWRFVVYSASIIFDSICWALAASILASAWGKARTQSLVMAAVLAVVSLYCMMWMLGYWTTEAGVWARIGFRGMGSLLPSAPPFTARSDQVVTTGWMVSGAGPLAGMQFIRTAPRGTLFWPALFTVISSVLALVVAILLAALHLRKVWQEGPPSPRLAWIEKTFCTPVIWVDFFRRWMRHKIERNPVGWLEQRRWSGRLVTWSWFAVIISLYSVILTDPNFFRNFGFFHTFIAWTLAGSIASTAAGSFRRERETGLLELLLVSPVGSGRLLLGRLRGLWGQFLLSAGTFIGLWAYLAYWMSPMTRDNANTDRIWFFGVTYLTLPVVGLYFSLLCRGFLSAFIFTLLAGLFAPFAALWILGNSFSILYAVASPFAAFFSGALRVFAYHPYLVAALIQGVMARYFGRDLFRRLESRRFPLDTAAIGSGG